MNQNIHHIHNLAYGGLQRTQTPDDVADQLIKDGLARRAAGGLVATDAAHALLIANGFKPRQWQ